ncbi:hypothetical protein ACTI_51710 [Actinoplanes sp. OR16]|uniref:hypothetical protein n=1 Tax=Actinoplanes sp. OR16 TaxID=946334 RepID=UPI000F7054E9|nr:hypothetical protein [Actinoplanes sp. OR16]BBH68486.1 hypothetical protein ACTI_51710 [Actinoplanes sp. OR16]
MNDTPQPHDDQPEPAPKKPLINSLLFTALGGLVGVYFLVDGALMVRDKHGNGVFALLMAAIVVIVGVLGTLILKSYLAERAARR